MGFFPGGTFFEMGLFLYTNRAITREVQGEDIRNRETQKTSIRCKTQRETECKVTTKIEILRGKEMKRAVKRNESITGVLI